MNDEQFDRFIAATTSMYCQFRSKNRFNHTAATDLIKIRLKKAASAAKLSEECAKTLVNNLGLILSHLEDSKA